MAHKHNEDIIKLLGITDINTIINCRKKLPKYMKSMPQNQILKSLCQSKLKGSFYSKGFLAICSTPKPENHTLSAVCCCLLNLCTHHGTLTTDQLNKVINLSKLKNISDKNQSV